VDRLAPLDAVTYDTVGLATGEVSEALKV